MKKIAFAALMLSGTVLLGGCSGNHPAVSERQEAEASSHGHEGHSGQTMLVNGDTREITSSVDILPSFLDNQSEEIRTVYGIAAQIQDVLSWIPCYCGCGDSAGHKNNLNCFINEAREDGSIEWDDHGTRCGVCLTIAVESAQMKQDGKSLTEIRSAIDEKYKTGYAKPTPTPMPGEAS